MIVMMMAITPSLNASNLPLLIPLSLPDSLKAAPPPDRRRADARRAAID
jgi:hypothetical protein